MKVDKAVCTNDTDVEQQEYFNRTAIGYNAVFTTLMENKFLAIKRECEEKQKEKIQRQQKKRSIGKLLSGNHIFCVKRNSLTENDLVLNTSENKNMCHTTVDCELTTSSNPSSPSTKPSKITTTHICDDVDDDDDEDVNSKKVVKQKPHATYRRGVAGINKSVGNDDGVVDEVVDVVADSGFVGGIDAIACDCTKNELLLVNKEKCCIKEKLNENTWNVQRTKATMATTTMTPLLNDEKNGTPEVEYVVQNYETESISSDRSKKISFQSDIIIDKSNDDKQQTIDKTSPNSSILEIYVSDDSLRKSRKSSSETTFSYPSSSTGLSKFVPSSFSAKEASRLLEHERQRLRVLEAKSISAQCSPIFPRSHRTTIGGTQIDDEHPLSGQLKQLSRQYTSDDTAANITFSSNLADDELLPINHQLRLRKTTQKSASSLAINGHNYSTQKSHDKSSVSRTMRTYDDSNTQHGFISSFNQLTSNNNKNSININLPVITTTNKKLRTLNCDKKSTTHNKKHCRKHRENIGQLATNEQGDIVNSGKSGGVTDFGIGKEEHKRIRKKHGKFVFIFV